MKKLLSALGALAMVGACLIASTTSTQAAPVAAAAETPVSYSPKDAVYFNNPYGDYAARQPIMDEVHNTIDSTPTGSSIRIAVYSWTREDTADKAIAAFQRGVSVQVLVDGHSKEYPATMRLQKTLGKDKSKSSFLVWCNQGCMSSKESMMHAKLYMFSQAGSSQLVQMIGSGNISTSPTSQAWNNSVTMVGNQTLWNSNLQYFNDMLKDKTNTKYYRTIESGFYKEYYFPRAAGTNTDTMLGVLKTVDCTKKPATGFGDGQGHTVVKVAMYAWTVGRRGLANRLVEMKKQGCVVEVVYSGERIEPSITQILLTKTVNGVIPIYNARLKSDYNTPYMHHKTVLISGVYGTNLANRGIYAGTANFTVNTEQESNEIMLRIGRDDFYSQFDTNFNLIRDHYATKVTSMKGLMPYTGDSVQANRERGISDDYQRLED